MTDQECDELLGSLFSDDADQTDTDIHPKAAEIKKRARQAVREAVAA